MHFDNPRYANNNGLIAFVSSDNPPWRKTMEKNNYETLKKYSLKAIQLIVIFMLLDFLSTFVAINILGIAKEINPIANAIWDKIGFWQGSIYLIAVALSPFIFWYFAILFAPVDTKLGRAFLIFSWSIFLVRIIIGLITLINNYAILTQFFLSKL